MFDFQLAPFIIAGLLVVTGYMFSRWLSNLGELRHWRAITTNLADNIEGMRAEGCAALGALQNIFNGVTAQGEPRSKTVQRVADVAAAVIFETPGCDHKERAEHATMRAESWEKIADRLAGEVVGYKNDLQNVREMLDAAVARDTRALENLWADFHIVEARAEEAERLLGLVNDRLVVERSLGRIL